MKNLKAKSGLTLLLVLAAVTFVGCLGPKTLGEALKARASLSSLQATTRSTKGQVQTFFFKLDKGVPVKTKAVFGGRWVLHDLKAKVVFMGSKSAPAVIKVAAKDPRANKGKAPDVEGYDRAAAVLGSEEVDGVACVKIEATHKEDGKKGTLWIGRKYGLLRQIKVGEDTTTLSYDQINAVPPSQFEIPAGAKIIDLTKMQEGLRNFLGGLKRKFGEGDGAGK